MKIALFLILILIATLNLVAEPSHVLSIVHEDPQGIRLQMVLHSYQTEEVLINGSSYQRISLFNEGAGTEKGMPELPYISRSFQIPALARVQARITGCEYEDIHTKVAPSRGIIFRDQDPLAIPYVFDEFYNSDRVYPASRSAETPQPHAELSEAFIIRDLRGITLYLHPFLYYPHKNLLRVFRSIELVLEYTYEDRAIENHLGVETSYLTGEFSQIYQDMFLNHNPLRYTQVSEQGRLLVIAHSSFINAIQPYVDWKRQKGIPTTLVNMSIIGTTADQLKAYIQNYYNQNPDLVFVQLVGDAAHIPTATYSWQNYSGASDPTLALVAGSDQYPDIFIGRFSCESVADLETQITRSIRYERDMSTADNWIQLATGIASNEGGAGGQGDNGESDEQHMQIIRSNLLNYGYNGVDQFYENSGATAAQVTAALNNGRGYLNYIGHGLTDRWGTTSFTNNHVATLNNQNKLPFIVSVACLNGNFVGVTCFAETWMRARVANNPTGAAVFYGSSISQPWNPPMRAQDEIVRLLTNNLKNTVGGLFYNGSCRMIEVYGTTNGGVASFRTWHIFGDVSMQVRSKTPLTMTPIYNQSISLDATSFTVNTGVSGALVALSHQNQIYGRGFANSNGIATFPITLPAALAQMTLTVTAFNRVSHIGSVQVVPSNQAYLLVDQFVYRDQNNNNPEVGEQGRFDIILKNIGSVQASNIVLNISSVHTGLSFIQSTTSLASLAALSQLTISNAFSFTLPSVAINQEPIPLIVNIQSSEGSWSTNGSLVISAPTFSFGSLVIDDVNGNNNRRLDPGESVTITKNIQNTGSFTAPPGTLTLSTSSQYIAITQSLAQFPALGVGQSVTLSFNLAVAQETPPGTIQNILFSINAGGYNPTHTDSPTVGLIIDDFESGNFTRFPWLFTGNQPWQISSSTSYDGSYSARSGTISHSQNSVMQLSLNVLEAGNVSFWRKVSSDLYYDKLNFYIDNSLMGSWHGEANWAQFSYTVNPGLRVFKWEYVKDVAISAGYDCGWIDDIIFPRSVPVTNFNPPRNLTAVQEGLEVILAWQSPITGIPTAYHIFRGNVQIAAVSGSAHNYRDAGISIGSTYQYKVRAGYNAGVSDFSNTVSLPVVAPAQLVVDQQHLRKAVQGDSTHSLNLRISNPGALNLQWTASVAPRRRNGIVGSVSTQQSSVRDMTGSWMTCGPASFSPGSLNTFTMSLKNMSNDGEYVSSASLLLPAGFALQSATAFTGGSSGSLVYSGINGSTGAHTWTTDDPSGWGVITPGETAIATINVFIQPSVSGDQQMQYGINGDEWGAPPHNVNGVITLQNQSGYWLSVSQDSGTLLPGTMQTLGLGVNGYVVQDGIYEHDLIIESNDPNLPGLVIPITIRIYRELDWFVVSGLSITKTPQGLLLNWDPLWEASHYVVEYSLENGGFQYLDISQEPSYLLDTHNPNTGFFRIKAVMEE